jgi:hypothetical protein
MIGTPTSLGHEVPGIETGEDFMQHLSEVFPDAQRVTTDATAESGSRDLNVDQFGGAAAVIGR